MSKKNELTNWLKNELKKRKAINPRFSIRNFAEEIGISKSNLSDALNEKISLSKTSVEIIIKNLKLQSEESQRLISLFDEKKKHIKDNDDNSFYIVSKHELSIIADWYFIAILSLAQFPDNEANVEWITSKIDISPNKAKEVFELAIKLKLIEIENGQMVRTTAPLKALSDVPSELIRKYHKTNLTLARDAIDNLQMNERILGAISIPTNKKLLSKTNTLINKFKQDISKTLGTTEPDSVYTLAIQLFPITK